jgi:hypothetical protein
MTDADADFVEGTAVRQAKAKLAEALGRNPEASQANVEEAALEILLIGTHPRHRNIKYALEQYHAAINTFWTRVYSDGTVERIARGFARNYPPLAGAIERVDLEAEVALQLRDQISRYDPKAQVPFRAWAQHNLIKYLRDWAYRVVGAVKVPQKYGRKGSMSSLLQSRQPFDSAELEARLANRSPHDPRALSHDETPVKDTTDGVWRPPKTEADSSTSGSQLMRESTYVEPTPCCSRSPTNTPL